MGLVKHVLLAATLVTLLGCTPAAPTEPPAAAPPAAPPAAAVPTPTPKPGAPVDVQLTTTRLADGRTRVVLGATPSVDVEALELRLGTRREGLGATRAGQRRELVVDAPAGTERLAGGAATVVQGRRRSRAAVVELGALPSPHAAVAPPMRTIVLPGGDAVAEVRP